MTAPEKKTNSVSTAPTRSHWPLALPDAGDVLPANKGMHATTVTPVCDDEPATVKHIQPSPASGSPEYFTPLNTNSSQVASSSKKAPGSNQTVRCHRLLLGPSEITTILHADHPAPHSKGKLQDSGCPDAESLSPLGPYDKHASASSDSYILLKPTCSRRDANSGTVSESPSVQSSTPSSNVFPISEDSEGNPLYIPNSCLDWVQQITADLQHRQGASSNLFSTIDLTFDGVCQDQIFPIRIEEVRPVPDTDMPSQLVAIWVCMLMMDGKESLLLSIHCIVIAGVIGCYDSNNSLV